MENSVNEIMVSHENVTYSNNQGISSVSYWLRDQTWLRVCCWCKTPEGVGWPRRAITRAITRCFDRWYPDYPDYDVTIPVRGAVGMFHPLDPPFHPRNTPWMGIQMSKILLMGIMFSFWAETTIVYSSLSFEPLSLGSICEIFIVSHSFGVISVKIWYPVKIHPAETPVGAAPAAEPPLLVYSLR